MTNITFLVEDNPVVRDSLIPTLEDLAQARVVGCVDTEQGAVDWLKANADWDIAVIDLFLRTGTGLGILQCCSSRAERQHMVVFTNYATEEMRRRCEIAGADAIFDKSTEIDLLIDYCRAVFSFDAERRRRPAH